MKRDTNLRKTLFLFLSMFLLAAFCACGASGETTATEKETESMTYEVFKSLSSEQKAEVFSRMTGPQVYALVAGSDQNWPVTEYDLISPYNAKETIVLKQEDEDFSFDLAWPGMEDSCRRVLPR